MKISRVLTLCAVAAAIFLSTGSLMAQADTGGNNTDNGGGQGGGQRRRGGPGGGGNFDPAALQQRMMDNVRESFGMTNDTDWTAVQPLVQKVMDARMAVGFGGGRGMFGRGNRGGGQGGPGGGAFGQQPNPDRDALQKALDDNAPVAQINSALAKYRASQKDKQAKLEKAQGDLLKVLTKKQEAEAALLGLVP